MKKRLRGTAENGLWVEFDSNTFGDSQTAWKFRQNPKAECRCLLCRAAFCVGARLLRFFLFLSRGRPDPIEGHCMQN